MLSGFIKKFSALELEEKILNTGALLALLSVFLPWVSGEWLGGDSVTYSGFGFYTSVMGLAIFALNAALLLLTLVPLFGGPTIFRRRTREFLRFIFASQAMILVLATLSVLTKVTFEFSRMEVRFGVYVCLIGSILSLFEASIRYAHQRKLAEQEPFRHPEDSKEVVDTQPEPLIAPLPPTPPPPAPPVEEHRLYTRV